MKFFGKFRRVEIGHIVTAVLNRILYFVSFTTKAQGMLVVSPNKFT